MPSSWSKHAYVQGCDFDSISFKKSINMYERMEIAESIDKGVVTPSYKKATRAESNCTGISRKKR